MKLRALTAVSLLAAAVTVASQEPLSIGMLREDGFLVPVATITDGRYQPLLAVSTLLENTSVFTPATRPLANSTWTVSRTSGEAMEITVFNRAMIHNHCSTEEAWRTSFKGKAVAEHAADIGKIGIAVRGGTAAQPQDVKAMPDESSRRIGQMVLGVAAAMEKQRMAADPNLLSDYLPRQTTNAALTITKLFRHTVDDSTTYFFETEKTPLPLMTTGWVVVDSRGAATLRDVSFTINDDGYKEGNVGRVIGLVPLPGRALWLMEWHGYEGERQAIHDWPSGVIRLTTPGAGC